MRTALALLLGLTACSAPAAAGGSASPAPMPAAASESASPTPTRATASPETVLPFCGGAAATDAVVRLCPDGVVLGIDAGISREDMAAIVTQVGADVAWVQNEFHWTLRRAVPVDVYADRDRYAAGLASVFG